MKNFINFFSVLALLVGSSSFAADKKITELPLGVASDVATLDVFPYVDVSASATQKLKLSELFSVPALSASLALKAPLISPSFTTPTLGVASATSINKMLITAPATSSTLAVADGKTFTSSNTVTLTATDGSTLAIGTGGTLGSNAYTSTSYAPISSPTFTGVVTIPTPFTLGATSVTTTASKLNLLTSATSSTGNNATNLVFSGSPTIATPTITTSATVPLVIGGTGSGSSLILQSTSGTGGSTDLIKFLVGNNGATEAMRINANGTVGVGMTAVRTLDVTGTFGATGASVFGSTVSATQYTSTIATGTAPLVVSSTTQVPNLYVARSALSDSSSVSTVSSAVTTTADNSTNANFFLPFVASSSSGNQAISMSSGLKFNPSTKALSVSGPLTINPAATFGVIKIARATDFDTTNMSIQGSDNGGTLNVLRIANFSGNESAIDLGGGTTGIINFYANTRTTSRMSIDSDGKINIPGTMAITGATTHTGNVGIGIAPSNYLTIYHANNAIGSVNYERLATNGMSTSDSLWTQYWANDSSLELARMGVTALGGGQMQWSVGNLYNGGVLSNTILALTNNAATISVPTIISDTTDSSSSTTGSVKTAGGLGVAKSLYVGTTINGSGNLTLNFGANLMNSLYVNNSTSGTGAGAKVRAESTYAIEMATYSGSYTTSNWAIANGSSLMTGATAGLALGTSLGGGNVTVYSGSNTIPAATFSGSNAAITGLLTSNSEGLGFTTTATAAGTTTLTISTATGIMIWTGSTTQTVKLPTTSIAQGQFYKIINLSSGAVTVQSSGANTIATLSANTSATFTALVATPTTAANWSAL